MSRMGDVVAGLGRGALRGVSRLATAAVVGLVVLYQRMVSPLLGARCRFTPSCSHYFREAVERYGPIRGSLKGLARIARCHPWNPGGHDPP